MVPLFSTTVQKGGHQSMSNRSNHILLMNVDFVTVRYNQQLLLMVRISHICVVDETYMMKKEKKEKKEKDCVV